MGIAYYYKLEYKFKISKYAKKINHFYKMETSIN